MFVRWCVRGGVGACWILREEKPAGHSNENAGVGQGIAEEATMPRSLCYVGSSFAVHESRTQALISTFPVLTAMPFLENHFTCASG